MTEEIHRWLKLAELDWIAVSHLIGVGTDNAVCFHVQQCIEKLLKGDLILNGMRPPRTHDLIELSLILKSLDPTWDWPEDELALLTRGAVEMRYELDDDSLLAEEARAAVEIGTRIRAVLLGRVSRPAPNGE